MSEPIIRCERRRDGAMWLFAFALLTIAVHVFTTARYGLFRDEFYYLECAEHLDFGYVDHPPLSIAVLWLTRHLFGDSVLAIRMPVILAGAATVVFAGLIARAMGGGRFAQALACLAVVISPVLLSLSDFFSMNAFDVLFWTLGAYVLVQIINTDNRNLWLVFGVIAGLGLQNKLSMLFFGGAVAVGIVATPLRAHLKDCRVWAGGLLALLIFLPHIIWQVFYGWPTIEFVTHAALYKNAPLGLIGFTLSLLLFIHPLNAVLCAGGLCFGFMGAEGRRYRAMSIAFLIVYVFLALSNGKPYYLAAAFPMALALGAVWFEQATDARRFWRVPAVVLMAIGGVIIAPYAIPVLPVDTFIAYQRALGLSAPAQERGHISELPQHFGDRFGWQEMTDTVAKVYNALPDDEKARCVIFVSNYGEAGALNYFGRELGLPRAVSGHNNCHFWPPDETPNPVIILIGPKSPKSLEGVRPLFDDMQEVARCYHPHAMGYENDLPVYICRGLKRPLAEIWPGIRSYT